MKNWKRLLALLLSGTMALSLFACKTGDNQPSGYPDADPSEEVSANPDANPSATPEIVADLSQGVLEFSAGMSAGDTVLTVNGEDVPADLFLYWLDYNCYYFMSYYGMFGLSLSDYTNDMIEDSVYFCVSQTLLRQKAAELGCLPTDAQVKEAQDSLDDETREMLKSGYGLSDDSINALFLSNAYYDNVMAALTHEPNEQELDEYLDSQGVFAVKHILLKTVDDNNQPLGEDVIAHKKETAEHLLTLLQGWDNLQSHAPENEGQDLEAKFDELMNEYSEDGGLATNPDGYVFDGTSSLVGGFREAALELEIGGLSGIVETDYGYHIMLRLPLTEETKAEYGANFRDDAMNDLVAQWGDAADVTRADALSTLDPEDFYNRLAAYQQALYGEEKGQG
ncbi:MAG: peptidylprolyl isomerase [Oscillospiraceae bacterium]|nr:peptidylprolyl isomerase [Oscillospiraceae bacterium]MDE7171879.1 peptidylprolyl isomerase [Oscillospiraceae bacterium]